MGREKSTAKRAGRNALKTARQKSSQRATLATMSSLAPQQHDTPHQGPTDFESYGSYGTYESYDGYDGYEDYQQFTDDAEHTHEEDAANGTPTNGTAANGELTHERARELIVVQTTGLLPPADANALADHLLTCDDCYRFAQDVAAQRRNAHANP